MSENAVFTNRHNTENHDHFSHIQPGDVEEGVITIVPDLISLGDMAKA